MVQSTSQRLPVPPSAADCRAGRQQTAPAQVTKTEAECDVMAGSSYERITHACISLRRHYHYCRDLMLGGC